MCKQISRLSSRPQCVSLHLFPDTLSFFLQNEFLRRVEQSSSSIVETMSDIQRKASLWIINTSSIPLLVRRIQRAPLEQDHSGLSEAEQFSRVAKVALTFVSKHCPTIYKSHVGEFAKALADEKNAQLGEVALQALAAIRWEANERYDISSLHMF